MPAGKLGSHRSLEGFCRLGVTAAERKALRAEGLDPPQVSQSVYAYRAILFSLPRRTLDATPLLESTR